ncbi:MAG: hypothetical protein IKP75_09280 [Oscillospiraceae bacterium]|nr:hypothetical protein [Oscillospiraceae bacterium]
MRKIPIGVSLLVLFLTSCGKGRADTLTYAVYPYLPDTAYYQELIEQRWAEAEPDIGLVRAEWDCYTQELPEDVDVLMYDAVMLDTLIEKGAVRPIEPGGIADKDDIYTFALDGLTVDGKLYGIPVFMCGNFLIYDTDCTGIADAGHLTDIEGSDVLVINSDVPHNRTQYALEVLADDLGDPYPKAEAYEDELMTTIDRLAVDAHKSDEDAQVAAAYDSGEGMGYIGFSESMRLLDERSAHTDIKSVSFGDRDDIPRLYVDAVAINSSVKDGERYEKCVELMNIIADADVLTELSVQNSKPQYLLLARKSPYTVLADRFPLYSRLKELASNENNKLIR